jgi:mannose-6-phosphate isomerase-like protein (cupin superfamily)
MQVIAGAGEFSRPSGSSGAHWAEQFRVPDLSVGTYSLLAGAADEQVPHTEDELYAITTGRGTFEGGGARVAVGPGTVIFVPAGEAHRFTEITEDLAALVFFGPAEGSRSVTRIVEFVTNLVDAFNSGVTSGDFARLLAYFTDDAVVRFENGPGGRSREYSGREAYTAAYLNTPPDGQLDLTGDPREEDGWVTVGFTARKDGAAGVLRLIVTPDDLIAHLTMAFG